MLIIIIILFFNSFSVSKELPETGQLPPPINFRLMDTDDTSFINSWETYKGKIVVLDFWATWCAPCIKALPTINKLVDHYPDSTVTFISVTYEPQHMLEPFFKKYKLNSHVAIDNDFATFRSFNAFGIPLVVIINKETKIAAVLHPDYLTKEIIDQVIAGKIPHVEPAKAWSDPQGAEEYFRSLIKK